MLIVLSQRKGGSGKSTIAVNLACGLLSKGYTVGLLDTDRQQSSYRWYLRRCKRHPERPSLESYYVSGDIRDNLAGMQSRNAFTIVDTAGFDSEEMRQAVVRANIVITPFRPKPYDLEQAKAHKSLMDEFRIANPKMRVYAVLNQCPTNHKDSRADAAEQFLEARGFQVLKSRLSNREAYGDSGEEGLGSIEFTHDKSAQTSATEVMGLTEEVLRG